MTDCFEPAFRSENMRRIKSTDTQPEMAVRRLLHRAGFRYRLHRRDLAGKPDLVLPKYRAALFVHGCFWHGHDCKDGRRPRSNLEYWNAKLDRNRLRDARSHELLQSLGWKPVVVWACQTRKTDTLQQLLLEQLRA